MKSVVLLAAISLVGLVLAGLALPELPECADGTQISSPCLCANRELAGGFCCEGVPGSRCPPFEIYGFASNAVGGSEGERVVVNTLDGRRDAHGEGFECPGPRCSIREAISRPNRVITFGVSGTIVLDVDLVIERPNLTLDGSTAPNGGIQFRSERTAAHAIATRIRADEIVVRHLRFRPGTMRVPGDGLTIEQGNNIVLDHVSCEWGSDECISVVGFEGRKVGDVTIQHSLIAEVFDHSPGQGKSRHSYGTAVGGDVNRVTFYRNVYALNRNRNPQLTPGSQGPGKEFAGNSTFEVVENVIYGFDVGSFVSSSSPNWRTGADFIRNVYVTGPKVNSKPQVPIQILTGTEKGPLGTRFGPVSVFLRGNLAWSRSGEGEPECRVLLERYSSRGLRDACHNASGLLHGVPFLSAKRHGTSVFPEASAGTIEESVLPEAGATLPCRDAVDRRVTKHVRDRTGTLRVSDPVGVGDYPDLTRECS